MKTIFLICFAVAAFATEKLRVYDDTCSETPIFASSKYEEIVPVLNGIGVQFERWEANKSLPEGAKEEDVLAAYREDIERLKKANGYRTVDIVKMYPDHPKKGELRNKFLNEHTHSEDEVRLFAEGAALFYLHVHGKVYIALCEKGDLISIPANYRHWFDMGPSPSFTAIRFFCDPSGWVANFTESKISENFPRYERAPVKAIITDIEGTTTSVSFVTETLFPYAKKHVKEYVTAHMDVPEVQIILRDVQANANVSWDEVVPTLLTWMEQDKKITPLKTLQGLMWEDGYRQGAFKGHVYGDAYAQLKQWKEQGIPLYVYSSGSILAQKLLFSHSTSGDMTPLFSNYFDTKVGGKKESASYRSIANQIGLAPEEILFLTDSIDEWKAAKEAGMQTVLVCRDGTTSDQPHVTNFNEIVLR